MFPGVLVKILYYEYLLSSELVYELQNLQQNEVSLYLILFDIDPVQRLTLSAQSLDSVKYALGFHPVSSMSGRSMRSDRHLADSAAEAVVTRHPHPASASWWRQHPTAEPRAEPTVWSSEIIQLFLMKEKYFEESMITAQPTMGYCYCTFLMDHYCNIRVCTLIFIKTIPIRQCSLEKSSPLTTMVKRD